MYIVSHGPSRTKFCTDESAQFADLRADSCRPGAGRLFFPGWGTKSQTPTTQRRYALQSSVRRSGRFAKRTCYFVRRKFTHCNFVEGWLLGHTRYECVPPRKKYKSVKIRGKNGTHARVVRKLSYEVCLMAGRFAATIKNKRLSPSQMPKLFILS